MSLTNSQTFTSSRGDSITRPHNYHDIPGRLGFDYPTPQEVRCDESPSFCEVLIIATLDGEGGLE